MSPSLIFSQSEHLKLTTEIFPAATKNIAMACPRPTSKPHASPVEVAASSMKWCSVQEDSLTSWAAAAVRRAPLKRTYSSPRIMFDSPDEGDDSDDGGELAKGWSGEVSFCNMETGEIVQTEAIA